MTHYLDTSLLVAALTQENDTASVVSWLSSHKSEAFSVSAWVATEFSAALSTKLRTGQIDLESRAAALAAFTTMVTESCLVLPISVECFRIGGQYASQHKLGLRAGDALHLAICAEHAATLCTLDRRLGKAGVALGMKTILL